ncbi:hypothetical protein Daura_47195 [Dactylosporangium aurantiacum]|uniref:HEAT repeat domain-containing protein n=1 Tax=Dactylosporangium aurantiacum TaxID=35754 RepID=A0A9Q9IGY1_9ACTN|nr:hypothetical protein [Dactylosporangium aurantiacum]MDG6105473.1 hypothetical protein [Dactylosporangium aurantiacum]UWZ53990.1 hypothetical protein Daura_47195 [Dactylosporangium aurantiacum]
MENLVRSIDDPDEDSDGTEAYEIALALGDSQDRAALPALRAHLDRYLDAGDFFGRDIIAVAVAGIAGVEALPVLLHAAARDLGDDQDGLAAEIWDVMAEDPARARHIIMELTADPDPAVRARATWAARFLPTTAGQDG